MKKLYVLSLLTVVAFKSLAQTAPSLKKTFEGSFTIGAALNLAQIDEKEGISTALIPYHFNSVTPENIMKSALIHPGPDQYAFAAADRLVNYARRHQLELVGHCLVWHSQLSPFAENMKDSDSFRVFFDSHIQTVASRYEGKVKGWDVVNEALNEDGTLRESIFYKLIGPDYILRAFEIAQRSAPGTELYYNDYNIEQPVKRAGALAIIKAIQAKGLRIDGVGIQGHWNIQALPLKNLEESILAFHALGVKVMITELDISVLPNPWDLQGAAVDQKFEGNPTMNPYVRGLPDSIQTKLTNAYTDLFRLLIKHKDKISRVTFWGVHDGASWLNGWPIKGRTNYPLLFDRLGKAKPALFSVTSLKPE
jgi:endo-1,4-beta-xylanase